MVMMVAEDGLVVSSSKGWSTQFLGMDIPVWVPDGLMEECLEAGALRVIEHDEILEPPLKRPPMRTKYHRSLQDG